MYVTRVTPTVNELFLKMYKFYAKICIKSGKIPNTSVILIYMSTLGKNRPYTKYSMC